MPAAVRLVHAQAHIESYAVDLSWDIIARFSGPSPATGLPRIPVACNNNSDDAADDASAVEENRDGEMTFEVLPRPFFENWLQVARYEVYTFCTIYLAYLPNVHLYYYIHLYCPHLNGYFTVLVGSSYIYHQSNVSSTSHLLFLFPLLFSFVSFSSGRCRSDEARHFMTWHRRLVELGAHYGVLPVHDGLWESALRTHGSLPARLAVVHMVHEAHGLDCGPQLAAKLRALGDARSAAFLQQIQLEEISHVGAGVRWFKHVFDRAAQVDKEKLALQQQKHDKQQHAEPKPEDDSKEEASSTLVIAEDANADTAADTAAAAAAKEKAATASCSSTHAALSSPGAQKQVALAYESAQVALFHQLVRTHFAGALRPPFAAEERLRAGMGPEWYEPLAGDRPSHRSSNSADAGSAEGGRRLLPHQIKAQERAERNAKLAKERAAAGLAIAAAKAAAKADAAAAAVGTDGEAADAAIDDMSADAVDTASSATVATNNATENSGDA